MVRELQVEPRAGTLVIVQQLTRRERNLTSPSDRSVLARFLLLPTGMTSRTFRAIAVALFLGITMIANAPTAKADCRDFGTLAVALGGGVGVVTALVTSGVGGAVASGQNEDVDGAVFGIGFGVGFGVALTSSALLSAECPTPEAMWAPSIASFLASTLAMVLFVELRGRQATALDGNARMAKSRPRMRGASLRWSF